MHNSKIRDIGKCLEIINSKKMKKIFILTGNYSLIQSGLKKNLIDKIDNREKIKIYYKEKSLPDSIELVKIFKSFKKFNPDLFIAIGGGSVLDYAKIINILKDTNNLINKIKTYSYRSKSKNTRLIAIPTTAGSGAEVTSNAVIYHNKIKYSFEDKLLIPDQYCLCSSALINVPKKIKCSSGFDAIAQAIESILSIKSSPKSIKFAKKSLAISNNFFLKYVKNPTLYNSTKMAEAANLSGFAINISKTTAPHACSYGFSAQHNISHGHAVSLNFERFMLFNFIHMKSNIVLKKKFEQIFKLTKTKNINEFINYIKYLKRSLDLTDNYLRLNININRDLDNILKGVNPLRLKNNPVELDYENLKNIILHKNF